MPSRASGGTTRCRCRATEDLPLPGCYCGRKGCIEAYLSGPALARDGDNLERYEERLARALAGVINILDPDVIVLGGGISNIPSLYTNVPVLWRPYVFSDQCGDPAGAAGARGFQRRARRGLALGTVSARQG